MREDSGSSVSLAPSSPSAASSEVDPLGFASDPAMVVAACRRLLRR
jgi:hypothetical protein